MKKIIIVAAILVLGFSGISNATLLYQDATDYYFNSNLNSKIWNMNIGQVVSAELSIDFCDDFDIASEKAIIKIDGVVAGNAYPTWWVTEKDFDVKGALIDGLLSLTVVRSDGDFYVTNVEVNGTPVPEPATMLLLGLGLVGLAGFGRKKFNS